MPGTRNSLGPSAGGSQVALAHRDDLAVLCSCATRRRGRGRRRAGSPGRPSRGTPGVACSAGTRRRLRVRPRSSPASTRAFGEGPGETARHHRRPAPSPAAHHRRARTARIEIASVQRWSTICSSKPSKRDESTTLALGAQLLDERLVELDDPPASARRSGAGLASPFLRTFAPRRARSSTARSAGCTRPMHLEEPPVARRAPVGRDDAPDRVLLRPHARQPHAY